MLNINQNKIDVYNCKSLCPLQFDVGYITEFIKQGKIFFWISQLLLVVISLK
jgi:hypothetical protein